MGEVALPHKTMGKVWVQAISNVYISENGITKCKYPGDWFEIGKHDARNLQAAGQVKIHNPVTQAALIPPESGILLLKEAPRFHYESLPIQIGKISIPYPKTMIWDPEFKLDPALIPVGLSLLEKWEIAVPISDYNLLARDIGTDDERAKTEAIIHELRVPVYDIRLVFVRKCLATEQLFSQWETEPGDRRLAFLRSLYQVKPYVLALPSIWERK